MTGYYRPSAALGALLALCLVAPGCQTCSPDGQASGPPIPRELDKVSYPDHSIAPPDLLLITGIRLIPKPPYRIEPLDALLIRSTATFADQPINGVFVVEPDGRVLFGGSYGSVSVVRLTIEEAQKAIQEHLARILTKPTVVVSLMQARGVQVISGEHLVHPNGKVDLGTYGSVYVAGLTPEEARQAIEAHLTQYLVDPLVTVSVAAYNSKVYYIITDGGGYGEQVFRLPATGNETVLDAMSLVNGLPAVACRERIWLARPAPGHGWQTYPIHWKAITRDGETATNYQLFPGDRIYVQANPLITLDTGLARVISPMERLFGITLLGNVTVESAGRRTTGSSTP
jgi:polysaccharide export outer membrane protein